MCKKDFLIPLLLLIPISIYFLSLEPSLVGGDGDEYLLQSYQNGIAHPCGYPVYLWIGKILLVLTNNNLNSMNIVSLLFSVFTLFLLYFFIRKIGVSPIAAIVTVLIYSFTPMFWKFATQAEVYNVNIFFLTLMLYLFYLWSEKHNTKNLLASGFVYGISLGVYFANILILIAIVIFLVYECKREGKNFIKQLLVTLVAIVIGATGPFLYIYFRSKVLPPTGSIYNPDNFKNFLLYLKGVQYKTLYFMGWKLLLNRIISNSALFIISFTGFGLFFAFKGIISEWAKRRSYTLFLLLSAMINFGYFSYYLAGDSYNMLGPSFLVVTIFIGLGLNKIYSEKMNLMKIQIICIALFITVITLQIYPPSCYRIINPFRKNRAFLNQCKEILSSLPSNSVFFAYWPRYTSFLCLQTILKQRQDISIYEISNRSRNYKINNEIKTFTWHEYIDNHILDTDRPIISMWIDNYLANKYLVKKIDKKLFQIYPKK